ncbi:menaquinol-cytochrome c reductase cytochrome c1 subunit precursor [Friedmanniella luteola]|uniref:Cytochrome bc1 complex cytochrome c subunit n=1 Tax=Friedmanniella luteola TaxID=546871 RepID=A0A1H1P2S9_9ACTN|nr:c-type cytochrome [Friedmanniella luteola]SDS05483.1 menaquinol-cytochrome c reductase cytochrome c1 subunit precursor [Friedmanniella luteola]
MRFLSSRRRHPAAKALLLVLGLFVMGAFYTVLAPAGQSSADTGTSQQVEEGRALFAVGCSSCHGLNGEGQASGEIQGPPLAGVGAAAVEFQVGTGRMPMARPEAQAPVKPNRYTPEEVAALAAFVATMGPGPEIPDPSQYDPAGLSEEEIARGGELFRTNCSACHNFEGAGGALPGGKYAPSLYGVSNQHIYEALITGPQQMPVFSDGVLKPEDKREIIAYLNTLHEEPSQGGLELGGLGPVSEGLWGWIIGIGGLSAIAVWIAAKGAKAK